MALEEITRNETMKAVRIQYGFFTGFLMVYGYLW
jgi:hypothetical protein